MSESFRHLLKSKFIIRLYSKCLTALIADRTIFIQQKTKLTPFLSEVSLLIN